MLHAGPSLDYPVHWQTSTETFVAPRLGSERRSGDETSYVNLNIVQVVYKGGSEFGVIVNGGQLAPDRVASFRLNNRVPVAVCLVLEPGAEAPVAPRVVSRYDWGKGESVSGRNIEVATQDLVPMRMADETVSCVLLPAPTALERKQWVLTTVKDVGGTKSITKKVLGTAYQAILKLTAEFERLKPMLQLSSDERSAEFERDGAAKSDFNRIMGLLALQNGVFVGGEAPTSFSYATTLELAQSGTEGLFARLGFEVQAVDPESDPGAPQFKTLLSHAPPAQVNPPAFERVKDDFERLENAAAELRAVVQSLDSDQGDIAARKDAIAENIDKVLATLRLEFSSATESPSAEAKLVRILPQRLRYVNPQIGTLINNEKDQKERAEYEDLLKALRESFSQVSSKVATWSEAIHLVQSYKGTKSEPEQKVPRESAKTGGSFQVWKAYYSYVDCMVFSGIPPADVALGLGPFVPRDFGLEAPAESAGFLRKLGLSSDHESLAAAAAFAEVVVYEVLDQIGDLQKLSSDARGRATIRERIIESAVWKAQQRATAASVAIPQALGAVQQRRISAGSTQFLGRRGGLDAVFFLRHLACWKRVQAGARWTSKCVQSATAFAKSLGVIGSAGSSLKLSPVQLPFMPTQSLGFFPVELSAQMITEGIAGARLDHLQKAQMLQSALKTDKNALTMWDAIMQSGLQAVGRMHALSECLVNSRRDSKDPSVQRCISVCNILIASSRPTLKLLASSLPPGAWANIEDQLRLPSIPTVTDSTPLLQSTWGARMLDRSFELGPEKTSSVELIAARLSKMSVQWTGARSFFVPYGAAAAAKVSRTSDPVVSESRVWTEGVLQSLDSMVNSALLSGSTGAFHIRLATLRSAQPSISVSAAYRHPFVVSMTQERGVEIPVALVRAAPLKESLPSNLVGIKSAVEWLWNNRSAEELSELEAVAEALRATMFNAERMFQGLQLALTQSGDALVDLVVHVPFLAGTDAEQLRWRQHVVRTLAVSFGMLSSVSARRPSLVRVMVKNSQGDLEEMDDALKASVVEFKKALQQQSVRVAPLAEMSAVLLGMLE